MIYIEEPVSESPQIKCNRGDWSGNMGKNEHCAYLNAVRNRYLETVKESKTTIILCAP